MHVRAALAVLALLIGLPVGVGAAARAQSAGPQPIYSAFSLIKRGNLSVVRCGPYRITRGTYTGRAASTDPRMAGAVTYAGQIARTPNGSYGIATGHLVIRDSRRRIRTRARVTGVFSQGHVVNGIVSGALMRPAARLRANVTIVFDDVLGFAVFRLGLESGANTGVAYPAVPKC